MIVQSAIMVNKEMFFTGSRHGDCFNKMSSVFNPPSINDNIVCGFTTDELTFLNREEGYYHAYKCGQCEEQVYVEMTLPDGIYIPEENWIPMLASEDLW